MLNDPRAHSSAIVRLAKEHLQSRRPLNIVLNRITPNASPNGSTQIRAESSASERKERTRADRLEICSPASAVCPPDESQRACQVLVRSQWPPKRATVARRIAELLKERDARIDISLHSSFSSPSFSPPSSSLVFAFANDMTV